jgi:hypothetical protein
MQLINITSLGTSVVVERLATHIGLIVLYL